MFKYASKTAEKPKKLKVPKAAKSAERGSAKFEKIARKIADIPAHPKNSKARPLTSIRFDPLVLAFFKASGPKWQTRINAILRNFMDTHKEPQE